MMPSLTAPAGLAALEAQISRVRDELFDVAEAARECAPHQLTQLHVSLQVASNELGKAERVLQDR